MLEPSLTKGMTLMSHGASHVTVMLALDRSFDGFAVTRTFFGGALLPEKQMKELTLTHQPAVTTFSFKRPAAIYLKQPQTGIISMHSIVLQVVSHQIIGHPVHKQVLKPIPSYLTQLIVVSNLQYLQLSYRVFVNHFSRM